jgi:hypothetical protein
MAAAPTPERVRVLLTDPRQTAADHDRNGDLFLDEGRANIAMMFYERSGSKDRLEKVLRKAVEAGDTFLVEWVFKLRPELVDAASWGKTGEAAMRAKKFAFARDAYQRAGDETRVMEAKKSLDQALGGPPPGP